jgi:hypothetical protein
MTTKGSGSTPALPFHVENQTPTLSSFLAMA